jgi:predicted nucleic-acid-binding Zn-ribbon protein
MQDQGTPVRVQGKYLRCVHCGATRFVRRQAQLHTPFMTFFNLDWLNKTAEIFVCTTCGRLEWFLDPIVSPGPAEDAEVEDDKAEPTQCMACGETIPAGGDKCPKCGRTCKK